MYSHVLIATDGSELATQAAACGVAVAKASGARVTVVTVSDLYPAASGSLFPRPEDLDRYERTAAEAAGATLDKVADDVRALGLECTTRHVADMAPAEGILEVCRQEDCDLIVMSTHARRGLDRLLLGSQAAKVVTLGKVSVLVAR